MSYHSISSHIIVFKQATDGWYHPENENCSNNTDQKHSWFIDLYEWNFVFVTFIRIMISQLFSQGDAFFGNLTWISTFLTYALGLLEAIQDFVKSWIHLAHYSNLESFLTLIVSFLFALHIHWNFFDNLHHNRDPKIWCVLIEYQRRKKNIMVLQCFLKYLGLVSTFLCLAVQ